MPRRTKLMVILIVVVLLAVIVLACTTPYQEYRPRDVYIKQSDNIYIHVVVTNWRITEYRTGSTSIVCEDRSVRTYDEVQLDKEPKGAEIEEKTFQELCADIPEGTPTTESQSSQ